MSDDATGKKPGSLFGAPLTAFVRGGGTPTGKHEQRVKFLEANAEYRRDQAAKDRKLASIPVSQGGAMMFEHSLASSREAAQAKAAHVLLLYLTPKGEEMTHEGHALMCLADITVINDDELALHIVCPRCKERLPQGQSQLQIRQSNKKWELDRTQWDGLDTSFPPKTGQPFEFEGKVYMSAGVVTGCERFRCPDCHWSAQIENNRVRSNA